MNKSVLFFVFIIAIASAGSVMAKSKKVRVGSMAPDFTLCDAHGVSHTLSAMRGTKVALLFYPKDQSPWCTKQVCSIKNSFGALKNAGIEVWGISHDSQKAHKKFSDDYQLPFPLLTDAHKKATNLYGVNGWLFISRWTFLVDEQGMIVAIIKSVDVDNHARQILDGFGIVA